MNKKKCFSNTKNVETIQCIDPKKKPNPKIHPYKRHFLQTSSLNKIFKKIKWVISVSGRRNIKDIEKPFAIPINNKIKKVLTFIYFIDICIFFIFLVSASIILNSIPLE